MNAIEAKKTVIMNKNSRYFQGAILHIYWLIDEAAKKSEWFLNYKWVIDNKLSNHENVEQINSAINILKLDGFEVSHWTDCDLTISWS